MTMKSLVLWWWGFISLFIANPLTLLSNLMAWTKIRGLDQPRPPYQQQYAPQAHYAPQQYAPQPPDTTPPQS